MSEILNEPASENPSATPSDSRSDSPSDSRSEIVEFLRDRGAAAMEHPGGTLLEHLTRVSLQLAQWGAQPEVQIAGLCHATYGTDGFAPSLLDLADRAALVELIGERPEALVYLYASCDRAVTYPRLRGEPSPAFRDRFTATDLHPAAEDLRAFLEITTANELDVFQHNEDLAARYGPAMYRLLEPVRSLLSDAAWQAVRRDLGAHSEG